MSDEPKQRRRRGCFYFATTALGLLATLGLAALLWYNYEFPYGHSHSCSKNLGLGLRLFANDHAAQYPCGGKTPEESLSLVCSNGDPYMLKFLMRGKHLPQSTIDAAFAKNGHLNPESCGWHYVEGLRKGDPFAIAVAWDKVSGLGHNGERREIDHEVIYLDGSTSYIPKGTWPSFCATQKLLLSQLIATRETNEPPIRWSDEAALGPNRFPPSVSKPK